MVLRKNEPKRDKNKSDDTKGKDREKNMTFQFSSLSEKLKSDRSTHSHLQDHRRAHPLYDATCRSTTFQVLPDGNALFEAT